MKRHGGLLIAVAVIAAATGSCRKRELPCHGEIDRDDLYRMQRRIDEGEEVCPQHLAPKIEADGSGVRLDGRVLANAAAIPTGSVRKIAPLFTELKMYREIWKQVHPGRRLDAHATVVIGGLDAFAGTSVLQTAAYAGYPRLRVECAGLSLEVYWAVPMPPEPEGEGPVRETMRVVREQGGSFTLAFPDRKPRPADSYARDLPGLLAAVQEACEGRSGACAHVLEIESGEGPFAGVARVVWALMESPAFARRRPSLRLTAPGA